MLFGHHPLTGSHLHPMQNEPHDFGFVHHGVHNMSVLPPSSTHPPCRCSWKCRRRLPVIPEVRGRSLFVMMPFKHILVYRLLSAVTGRVTAQKCIPK